MEKQQFDPRPPTDDDWTAADEEEERLTIVTRPRHVGEVLEGYLRARHWEHRIDGVAVFSHWPAIVGASLVRRCEPVRLTNGTLVVRAESQIWATQLGYMVTQLRDRANEVLGAGMVREVRIVVGPLTGGGA